MVRLIRPSTTRSTTALYAKSLLNAGLFFSVFMVVLPWLAAWLIPVRVPIPGWIGAIGGGVLALGGAVLWLLCLDVFSRRGRGTPLPLDAPARLVETGPFAVLRNPIMAGELSVIWGVALYSAQVGIFLYAAIISAAAHLSVIFIEEPELRQRFGQVYEAYCRRVPRWLPRMRMS